MALLLWLVLVSFLPASIVAISIPFAAIPVPSEASKQFAVARTFVTQKTQETFHGTSRFDKLITKLFDDADRNRDGKITFQECYALVLKIYIYINRQAPIPPPTRKAVRCLFDHYDENRNNAVSREEFTALAHVLGRRAIFRVATHKTVQIVGAPIFAVYTVRRLKDKKWIPKVAEALVPRPLHKKVLPVVTSQPFCRTVLVVSFVTTLGNIATRGVNVILRGTLPEEDKEDTYID